MVLTEKDVDEIERIVDERLEFKFPNLSEKVDKMLTMLTEFLGRLEDVEEEQTIHNKQSSEQVGRIEALEKVHPGGQHIS